MGAPAGSRPAGRLSAAFESSFRATRIGCHREALAIDQRRRILLAAAVLTCLVGLVFIGQGLGLLQGRSFMVGDRLWAVIGAVLVVVGGWLGWRYGLPRG